MSTYRLEFLGKVYSLLCVTFVVGQREVDIAVYGNMVVKTDIASYTVFGTKDDYFETTLTISCTSFVRVSSTLEIVRNDTILNSTSMSDIYNNRTVFKEVYSNSNVASSQGNYSCRLHIAFQANDSEGSFSYCMESEIQIKTNKSLRICASSIGFYGYVGEKVTLTCTGDEYSNYVNFLQGEWLVSRYILQSNLLEDKAVFKCTKPLEKRLLCRHNFTVERSLEIKLSPNNFTLESNNTKFVCNSTPRRLLYWEIIGNDGNILDLQNVTQLRDLHANVTIIQRAGWSSLQISTLAANKVNKIVCSTYGTRIRAVAYATLASIPEDDRTCPCNVPSSTFVPTSTIPPQTTMPADKNNEETSLADLFSIICFGQIGVVKEGNIDVTQPATSLQTLDWDVFATEQEEESNFWIILTAIAIASCETLLLLIIAGIWSYSRYVAGRKDPKKSSSTSEFRDNIISSETEMQDNPIYLQYQ